MMIKQLLIVCLIACLLLVSINTIEAKKGFRAPRRTFTDLKEHAEYSQAYFQKRKAAILQKRAEQGLNDSFI
eukprot:UN02655